MRAQPPALRRAAFEHQPSMSAPAGPPTYKGEPLDAERGPGLGCFWIQVGLLTFLLVLTPLTVVWAWDPFISGALLILTLVLLLFAGQTIIFLLRLVAADRRTRRAPLDPKARRTVGQMEDEAGARTTDGDDGTPGDADTPGGVGTRGDDGSPDGDDGSPGGDDGSPDRAPPESLPPSGRSTDG